MSKEAKITALLDKGLSVKDITKRLKVPAGYVYTARWKAKKKTKTTKAKYRSPRSRLIQDVYQMKKALNVVEKKPEVHTSLDGKTKWVELPTFGASDLISHPPHYTVGGVETWDFIEAKRLNYNLGSVVKYISRADYKEDDIGDLRKAREFLDREIKRRENDRPID